MKLFHPAIGYFENSEKETYIKKIEDFYFTGYEEFVKEYGYKVHDVKVLPNEGFIKYLKSIGRIK